ncbi:MAG: putative DNA modification/repair radical SAM protein [Clostridiales Family XIII bacterium]|jgi:putative DNA modification/repair radical SAM protein|nr:putative DNA modification/repair radical SAM protein [Clostridiales Family XIII bacterium]
MDSSVMDKLAVLGEGAKYDVSCSSSGADRSNIGRIGSATCAGICHSWTADGRCVSLLKILLSNDCAYDCKYCINRRTSEVTRRTFEPRELADLTIEFYRRNYIEGLFLSSAVLISPDHTAERMYECLWILREEYGFAGYIHAKVIPGTSPELLHIIGLVSDRLSVNIELPSEASLARLAPQKRVEGILAPMRQITETQAEYRTLSAPGLMGKYGSAPATSGLSGRATTAVFPGADDFAPVHAGGATFHAGFPSRRGKYRERFAPAGQTTQMIIGASDENDRHIIGTSETLYRRFSLKRVYFSAYIPVASAPELPDMTMPPPLKREHRLYQADWLLRFYGFRADEILPVDYPNLDYDLDPKAIWALRHLEFFPIEINKASPEELLRIPGVGNTSAKRIVRQRREAAVRYDDLKKMGVVLKRAKYFLTCSGRYYGDSELEPHYIRDRLARGHRDPRELSADASASSPILDEAKIRGELAGDATAQISMFDAISALPGAEASG